MNLRVVLVAVLGLLSACQSSVSEVPAWQAPAQRDHAQLGVIEDLRTGQRLTPEMLLARLASAPQVVVGEKHDNPDHHALQLWLLRGLARERSQGSLLLEMLNPDQQGAVDAVQQRLRQGERLENLPRQLGWQQGWAWSLYGPLVSYALSQPYPLLAANLDRDEIMAIYRSKPVLNGEASTAASVQQALLDDIRESHCGLLPETQLPAMLAVQQQRDRRMAERLLAAPAPALLLAGGFHVRKDLGIPLHMKDLAGIEPVVLILVEAGQTISAEQADYAWYTAALPEQDYSSSRAAATSRCAQMRR